MSESRLQGPTVLVARFSGFGGGPRTLLLPALSETFDPELKASVLPLEHRFRLRGKLARAGYAMRTLELVRTLDLDCLHRD